MVLLILILSRSHSLSTQCSKVLQPACRAYVTDCGPFGASLEQRLDRKYQIIFVHRPLDRILWLDAIFYFFFFSHSLSLSAAFFTFTFLAHFGFHQRPELWNPQFRLDAFYRFDRL